MTIRKLIILISTFFYLGYLPAVPGTFASIAGVILFYLVRANSLFYLLFTLFWICLGFLVSGKAEGYFNRKDPKYIVIDEVAGMFLSLICLPFYNPQILITAFVLFRILDTLKPYPADKFQELNGSLGIMSDDLTAALYTNVILQIVTRIMPLSNSP